MKCVIYLPWHYFKRFKSNEKKCENAWVWIGIWKNTLEMKRLFDYLYEKHPGQRENISIRYMKNIPKVERHWLRKCKRPKVRILYRLGISKTPKRWNVISNGHMKRSNDIHPNYGKTYRLGIWKTPKRWNVPKKCTPKKGMAYQLGIWKTPKKR